MVWPLARLEILGLRGIQKKNFRDARTTTLLNIGAATATDRFYKKTVKYFKESRSVVSARKSDSLARKLLYDDA